MAGEGNGNQTLAQLIADARKQMQASGDDSGPIDKLTAVFTKFMDDQQKSQAAMEQKLKDMESRTDFSLVDQVVEGQQSLRHAAIHRKGGFQTLDQAELVARLIDPAGLTMQQKLVMSTSQLNKYISSSEQVQRVLLFQELNDDAHLLGWILATKNAQAGTSPSPDLYKEHLKGTRTYRTLQSVVKALTTTGSTTGAEWIPTQFSSQLLDVVTVSLKVAAQFDRIAIPANTFKVPLATSDDVAFLVTETTNDNLLNEANVYPKFTPTTSNITFNAKKMAAIIVFSEEAEEDSIIPMMPFVRGKIARAQANAQERATLDGDTTATHQDNDVTAATDFRKAWKGLRKFDIANSLTQSLATFNLTNIRLMRSLMDAAWAENPENLFYTTSVKVMLKMLSFPEFLTIDKYGPKATIITGEVGRIDGSPLLTSKYSRDDVAATGVNTSGGPNNTSLLYLQNRNAYWYGDRREVRIDGARLIISGQGYVVITQRVDFVQVYPMTITGNKSGALGIAIA